MEPLSSLLERYALRALRRLGTPAAPRSAAPRPLPQLAVARGPAEAPLWPLDLGLQRDPAAGWEWLASLRGQEVHVVGYTSAEGAAVTDLLWQEGVHRLVLHDLAEPAAAAKAFAAAHVGLEPAERRRRWATLEALPVSNT